MKKLLYTLFIVFFIASACKKDPERKMSYLENGNWQITTYTINGINALDTFLLYFPENPYVFTRDVSRYSYDTHYKFYSGASSGTIVFTRNYMERCIYYQVSPYLIAKSDTFYDIYTQRLGYLNPPLVSFSWDVLQLNKSVFALRCFYKKNEINLVFTKQ